MTKITRYIREFAHTYKAIIRGEDGVYIFWPEVCSGAWNSDALRVIADELDYLNNLPPKRVQ